MKRARRHATGHAATTARPVSPQWAIRDGLGTEGGANYKGRLVSAQTLAVGPLARRRRHVRAQPQSALRREPVHLSWCIQAPWHAQRRRGRLPHPVRPLEIRCWQSVQQDSSMASRTRRQEVWTCASTRAGRPGLRSIRAALFGWRPGIRRRRSLIGVLRISARYPEQLTPFDAKLARHQLAIPMRRHRSGV